MKKQSFSLRIKQNPFLVVLPVLTLICIFFAVMSINAFITEPVIAEEVVQQSRQQTITYDFRVYPSISTLYPQGTEPLPPGKESYFTNVTEKVECEVVGEIVTTPSTRLDGDFRIRLLVRSEEQWEKELNISPQINNIEQNEGVLKFSSIFNIPFKEAAELAEVIIEELEVRPRQGYSIVVESTLLSPALEGEEPNTDEFTGEYSFMLSGRLIEPKGELIYEKNEEATETINTVNYISFLGSPMEISRAKVLFPPIFLALLIGLGFCCYFWRKKRLVLLDEADIELRRIRKRYSGRIVKAGGLHELPEGTLKVEMESFKDLVKIADERERPILEVSKATKKKSAAEKSVFFYIVDDETLYFFTME